MINTGKVEQALVAFFQTQDIGADVLPGAGGVMPDHEACVIIKCPRAPHIAGEVLFEAFLELEIQTPSLQDNLSEVDHANLVQNVIDKFNLADEEDISVKLEELAGCQLSGWFLMEPVDEHQDGRWKSRLRWKLGLERLG